MFEDEVKQYMFAVNETWLSNENKNIHIEGYKFFPLCRGKEMGKNRGGIGWFIREDLRKWIKIMFEMSNENFLWCKLDKHFLILKKTYMYVQYIYPLNTRQGKNVYKKTNLKYYLKQLIILEVKI